MRRVLWLGIGLAVGALVFRAVTKKAQAFTPGGIAGSLGASAGTLLYSARRFEVDLAPYPHILAVDARAADHPAFQAAHPDRQPDAS